MQTACSILKKNGFAVITAPPGALITAVKPLKVDGAGKMPAIKKGRQIFGVLSSPKTGPVQRVSSTCFLFASAPFIHSFIHYC